MFAMSFCNRNPVKQIRSKASASAVRRARFTGALLALGSATTIVLPLMVRTSPAFATFDIEFVIADEPAFPSDSLLLIKDAIAKTEQLWEGVVLGHQHISQPVVFPIVVGTTDAGLAWGNFDASSEIDGFVLPSKGSIYLNPDQIPNATNGFGIAPGMNLLDDVVSHEVGHVLGIGTLWEENGVYGPGSGRYTGVYGLEAYRDEFDPDADFVPVELVGGEGRADAHWDQIVRTSIEEGDPSKPLSLSPLLGIVDDLGRDFAMELMSSVLNPDYGEPFLSNTTLQSLRDLGYTVVGSLPRKLGDLNADDLVNVADVDILRSCAAGAGAKCVSERFDLDGDGTTSTFNDLTILVQDIASTFFGDATFDGEFNSSDFVAVLTAGEYEDGIAGNSTWATGDWDADAEFSSADLVLALTAGGYELGPRAAVASVPEPDALDLAAIGCVTIGCIRQRRRWPKRLRNVFYGR